MRTIAVALLVAALPGSAAASHTDQEPLPAPATVRVGSLTRATDPGPPWALRSWRTVRAPRDGLAGGETCFQVGRLEGARLVRTFAGGATRELNLRDRSVCGRLTRTGVADTPILVERLVGDPTAAAPRIEHTLVAGLAPTHVRSVEVLGAGPTRSPQIDPRNRTWLVVLPGDVRQAQLTLHYRLRHGARRVDLRTGDTAPYDDDGVHLVRGSVRRPLTAADPTGRLPFGLVTYAMEPGERRSRADWCTEPGRVVDGEIGPYEPTWGSFLDAPVLVDLPALRDVWLPHGHPVNSVSGCDDTYEESRPIEGLGVRRFARDVIVLHGPLRADVRRVSVVATTGYLAEAAVGGGAFLAPVRTTGALGERVTLTARLADGRSASRTVAVADREHTTRWAQYAPLPDGSGVRLASTAVNADDPFVGVDVERRDGRLLVAVRELSGPDFLPDGSGSVNFLQVDVRCVDLVLEPADARAPLFDAADVRARRRVALADSEYGAPTTCVRLRPGERLPVRSRLAEDLKGF